MATAKIRLANGTVVEIEGAADEIKELLEFYGTESKAKRSAPKSGAGGKAKRNSGSSSSSKASEAEASGVDLTAIVNLVKSCDEAEDIETNILDKNSQVDRTLLPLYIVYEHLNNEHALSSGDISRITTQLSVPVATANASRTLSGTASRYVMGDTARKKGATVRYKLNRRGLKYMQSVVSGSSDG